MHTACACIQTACCLTAPAVIHTFEAHKQTTGEEGALAHHRPIIAIPSSYQRLLGCPKASKQAGRANLTPPTNHHQPQQARPGWRRRRQRRRPQLLRTRPPSYLRRRTACTWPRRWTRCAPYYFFLFLLLANPCTPSTDRPPFQLNRVQARKAQAEEAEVPVGAVFVRRRRAPPADPLSPSPPLSPEAEVLARAHNATERDQERDAARRAGGDRPHPPGAEAAAGRPRGSVMCTSPASPASCARARWPWCASTGSCLAAATTASAAAAPS